MVVLKRTFCVCSGLQNQNFFFLPAEVFQSVSFTLLPFLFQSFSFFFLTLTLTFLCFLYFLLESFHGIQTFPELSVRNMNSTLGGRFFFLFFRFNDAFSLEVASTIFLEADIIQIHRIELNFQHFVHNIAASIDRQMYVQKWQG